jgi:phage-related protein
MDDFVGFSFGGVHSSTLGIIRTSEGSRYNQNLFPTIQEQTVRVPGGEGTYYFGSNYTQRQFSIFIAFDSLTEELFRKLLDTFGTKELKQLVFDEAPYKYYMVKTTGLPQLKYICFDENGERIYKGEGILNFIAYFPFAKSVHKFLSEYSDLDYPNKDEWAAFTNMKSTKGLYDGTGTTINLFNAGQLETDFYAYFKFTTGSLALSNVRIETDSKTIGILNFSTMTAQGSDTYIRINSKTNLIEGCVKEGTNYVLTGKLYNSYITSGDFFKIPIGESTLYADASCEKIEYDYLYY